MRYVLLALLALTFGCKGKPKHREPPANYHPQQPRPTGSGGSNAAPDIVLPHGNGSPPKKTTAPFAYPELMRLAQLVFKGFQIEPRGLDPKRGVEVRQKTEDHPRIVATITISRCGNGGILGDCLAMDALKWQQDRRADLMKLIPVAVRDLPDTLFEIGSIQLNKTPMIYMYELGFAPVPAGALGSGSAGSAGSAAGSGSGSASASKPGGAPPVMQSHSYTLFYNDGVNQIRVVAEYADAPKPTRAALLDEVPRGDLEAVARAFVDIYTQLW